jgi:hypothetical protein
MVLRAIQKTQPKVIVLIGGSAVESLLGQDWDVGIAKWAGWQIPSQTYNAWICPTYHPAHIARVERKWGDQKRQTESVASLLYYEHLRKAFAHKKRPWNPVPDYRKQVTVMESPSKAHDHLITCLAFGPQVIAFDYECTMLKPEPPKAAIITCAMTFVYPTSVTTLAFPWHGKAIKAAKTILQSSVPKIGANIKFEQRWTQKHLGCRVRNWVCDVINDAHVLDNRRRITSLAFQTFVRLGFDKYDQDVTALKTRGGGCQPNRIRSIDRRKLMLYNGLDALTTYLVAKEQAKEFGERLW